MLFVFPNFLSHTLKKNNYLDFDLKKYRDFYFLWMVCSSCYIIKITLNYPFKSNSYWTAIPPTVPRTAHLLLLPASLPSNKSAIWQLLLFSMVCSQHNSFNLSSPGTRDHLLLSINYGAQISTQSTFWLWLNGSFIKIKQPHLCPIPNILYASNSSTSEIPLILIRDKYPLPTILDELHALHQFHILR